MNCPFLLLLVSALFLVGTGSACGNAAAPKTSEAGSEAVGTWEIAAIPAEPDGTPNRDYDGDIIRSAGNFHAISKGCKMAPQSERDRLLASLRAKLVAGGFDANAFDLLFKASYDATWNRLQSGSVAERAQACDQVRKILTLGAP